MSDRTIRIHDQALGKGYQQNSCRISTSQEIKNKVRSVSTAADQLSSEIIVYDLEPSSVIDSFNIQDGGLNKNDLHQSTSTELGTNITISYETSNKLTISPNVNDRLEKNNIVCKKIGADDSLSHSSSILRDYLSASAYVSDSYHVSASSHSETGKDHCHFCDDTLATTQDTATLKESCRPALGPYCDLESDDDGRREQDKNSKRKRNPKHWKKSIRKNLILAGEEYESSVGKVVKKREIKASCQPHCRRKCWTVLPNNERQEIYNHFWSEKQSWDMKRLFIVSTVESTNIERRRPGDNSRENKRKRTNKYFLTSNGKKIEVCKTMYLNTLSISEQFVRTAQLKSGDSGLIICDERGKHLPANKCDQSIIDDIKNHITAYPAYSSHDSPKKYLGPHLNVAMMYKNYSEECNMNGKPEGKEWLFRKIFNKEFNLAFKQPDLDTCDTYDADEVQLKDILLEEEKE